MSVWQIYFCSHRRTSGLFRDLLISAILHLVVWLWNDLTEHLIISEPQKWLICVSEPYKICLATYFKSLKLGKCFVRHDDCLIIDKLMYWHRNYIAFKIQRSFFWGFELCCDWFQHLCWIIRILSVDMGKSNLPSLTSGLMTYYYYIPDQSFFQPNEVTKNVDWWILCWSRPTFLQLWSLETLEKTFPSHVKFANLLIF